MLSMATTVEGQGVGSAYMELLSLIKEYGKDDFEVYENKGINYDVLHSQTVEPRNYLKFLFTKGTTVAHVHFLPETLDGSVKLPGFAQAGYKKYVMSFYKRADHLVVVNPSFIKEMIKAGLDKEKITYIPNFVSKKKFYNQSSEKKKQTREKYSIDDNAFVVLAAGQIQTRKGVSDFIKVAEMLPDVSFVWAGGFSFGVITDGYQELKKIVENPPENVKFTGIVSRDEMNNLFNAADVYFSPSYNELFPMTILEAASTETPILLRNLDLYKDILDGKYLYGDDNETFKDHIENLKNDKNIYALQIEKSKEISFEYSEENVYNIWKEYYTKIVKENRKKK